jgi:urease
VDFAGSRIVYGGNGWLSGNLNQHHLIPELIEKQLFRNVQQPPARDQVPYQMSRLKYIQCYGPTAGDKVRLGDTELFLEIEKDFAFYGDEIVFGGGKVIRDGMGQMSNISEEKALDLVITNVIVVGIFLTKFM